MSKYTDLKLKIRALRKQLDELNGSDNVDKSVIYEASLQLDKYINEYLKLEQTLEHTRD